MTTTENSDGLWKIILTAALMIAILGLAMVMGAEAQTNRLDRKVRVMERVLDEILVQSENVMVGRREVTRGLILNEFGALFLIEGSLGVNEFIVRSGSGPWSLEEGELWKGNTEAPPKRGEDERMGWKEMQKKAKEQKEANLAGLKNELSEALVDYGATLAELKDDQWVAIALFLGEPALLGGDQSDRLVLKIRMRDLRQHASGALSYDAAMKKVIIEAS